MIRFFAYLQSAFKIILQGGRWKASAAQPPACCNAARNARFQANVAAVSLDPRRIKEYERIIQSALRN
jgi:hypothetical protein